MAKAKKLLEVEPTAEESALVELLNEAVVPAEVETPVIELPPTPEVVKVEQKAAAPKEQEAKKEETKPVTKKKKLIIT